MFVWAQNHSSQHHSSDCATNKSKYGITDCRDTDDDYWGGAMKACAEKGMRLPNADEIAKVATELYGTNVGSTTRLEAALNQTKAAQYGFQDNTGHTSSFDLWSNQEYNVGYAYRRTFTTLLSKWGNDSRNYFNRQAFCVVEE